MARWAHHSGQSCILRRPGSVQPFGDLKTSNRQAGVGPSLWLQILGQRVVSPYMYVSHRSPPLNARSQTSCVETRTRPIGVGLGELSATSAAHARPGLGGGAEPGSAKDVLPVIPSNGVLDAHGAMEATGPREPRTRTRQHGQHVA